MPQYRKALPGEVETLAELDKLSNYTSWSAQKYADVFLNAHECIYVLEDAGQIIGAIVLSYVLTDGDILQLWVRDSHKSRGYGRLLLNNALDALRLLGTQRVFLEVMDGNEVAIILYTKFGFDIIGQRKDYYRVANSHYDACLMKLEFSHEK